MGEQIKGWFVVHEGLADHCYILAASASWEGEQADSGDYLDDHDTEDRPDSKGLWLAEGTLKITDGSYYYPNDVDAVLSLEFRRLSAVELSRFARGDKAIPDPWPSGRYIDQDGVVGTLSDIDPVAGSQVFTPDGARIPAVLGPGTRDPRRYLSPADARTILTPASEGGGG